MFSQIDTLNTELSEENINIRKYPHLTTPQISWNVLNISY